MAGQRTFIAIELDQELQETLARLQSLLRKKIESQCIRWVRPEGIHLTLKFLGDTSPEQVAQVKEALARAAATAAPFDFTVGGVGCFPNTRRPRVVWVGVHEPTGALKRLRDAVEEQVAPLGFPTEKRRFSPHLTLGRVHRRALRSEVQEVGEVVAASAVGDVYEMHVGEVCYIESDLRPGGAVYRALSCAELGG
ncbi:MAG: RNA 2',3'-cyclic phosphodiesterase [Anaerolineae bacterium]|jgi:RNA 2',3'-cyclic 3'-phosphodiesterase